MKKNENSLFEKLQLPKDITRGAFILTAIGSEEVYIENYKGILEYDEEMVRIGTAAGVLRLTGKELCLKQLSAECMVVTGKIENIGFLT